MVEYRYNKVGNFISISEGIQIHYLEEGSGEALVFLHGGGPGVGSSNNWSLNLNYFSQNYRVIAPDMVGYGLSSKPEDATFDLAFLVKNLKRFWDAANIQKATIIGNSLGAAVALKFALDYPDCVSKLILAAPAGIGDMAHYAGLKVIDTLFGLLAEGGTMTRDKVRRILTAFVYEPSIISDELVEQRYEMAQDQPLKVFTTITIDDMEPHLGELEMPVLVFWGREDEGCPLGDAYKMEQKVKDCRLVVFSQCGHMLHFEKAKQFNQISSLFLKEQL